MITAVSLNSSLNSNYDNSIESIHVDSGEISHHIVHILLHNHDLLDKNTELGKQQHNKNIDVLNIGNQT